MPSFGRQFRNERQVLLVLGISNITINNARIRKEAADLLVRLLYEQLTRGSISEHLPFPGTFQPVQALERQDGVDKGFKFVWHRGTCQETCQDASRWSNSQGVSFVVEFVNHCLHTVVASVTSSSSVWTIVTTRQYSD
jgi:hypothetical protein